MSDLTIFVIKKNGNLERLAEIENSCRGAELFWDWMEKTYLPFTQEEHSRFIRSFMDDFPELMDPFWNLVNDEKVPLHHRIVLAHTLDAVMVRKDDLPLLIDAFEKTAVDMGDDGHLLDQVQVLKPVLGMKDVIGTCWIQSGANEYSSWGSKGTIYHEDRLGRERSRPFNIFKDNYYRWHVHVPKNGCQWWLKFEPTRIGKELLEK